MTRQCVWALLTLSKYTTKANHTLLLSILQRYGVPQKFVPTIHMIYTANICMLKIEKEIVEISQSVGARHGASPIPLPHDGICRNSRDILEAARDLLQLLSIIPDYA